MSTPNPQRKRLPVKPSEENLRKQAKRRAKIENVQLAEAQHRLAAEYGCRNWAELLHVVETMNRGADHLSGPSNREREPLPKAANQKDIAAVRAILASGEFTQHDLDLALARSVLAYKERGEIARLLVEHGADPDGQYGANYGPIVFVTGECLDVNGLQFLIDQGADVTFKPLETKYGNQCPLSYWLGTYVRGSNEQKHRGVEILLKHGAFVPPEVTPPMLAIHRGDAKALTDLLDQDPALLKRRFPEMPYGNIALAGATLLHCAVEFGEIECLDELLNRFADINMKADVIDGIGAQTPIFHVINTYWDSQFQTLEHLAKRVGHWVDTSVKATFRWHGETHGPLTPLEFSEERGQAWGRNNVDAERQLLRSLDRRHQLAEIIGLGEVGEAARVLDAQPELLTPQLWPPAIVQAKSLELTRLLLDRGLNPDECSAPRKPLHLAVYQCLPDIVELLIARGADVNSHDTEGNTPLWVACQSPALAEDRIEVAKALIGAGARVREGCKNGSTALHIAAWRGPIAMVELLIRHGAKEWQTDNRGKKPIDDAREKGVASDRDAIIELLDRPVIRDPNFRQAVAAIQTGDLAALQRLLADDPTLARDRAVEPDCYPPSYFSNPKLLWFVANNPNLIQTMPYNITAIAKAIIDAGVEPSDLDYTLGLVMTSTPARQKNLQRPLMKLLLDRGAKVSADDLYGTLGHRERDAIVTLLESGLPLTAPLAAGLGRLTDLAHLLASANDAQRHAALSMAVINREVEAARLCLTAGADVNAFLIVHRHSLPIHQAALDDDVPMLRLLIEYGAKLDIRDTMWNGTPLGWAVHTQKTAAEAYLRSINAR